MQAMFNATGYKITHPQYGTVYALTDRRRDALLANWASPDLRCEPCDIVIVEHGDVVDVQQHVGGRYDENSILRGGEWVTRRGVVDTRLTLIENGGFAHSEPMPALNEAGEPEVAWVRFFDGGSQATKTNATSDRFPVGGMVYVGRATEVTYG